ncbi:MAG: galactose mutarotase [Spirochaetales bacterium]|nr:galactose mutarotase [Spirochaetales bacterium]
MKIKKRLFGVLSNGQKVSLFTVSSRTMSFSVTNYGCIITSIMVPGKDGSMEDVALGYSTLDGYVHNPVFFGCIVGRYANRIAGASFTLDGKIHRLTANDGPNCLHSGRPGYHKMVWEATPFCKSSEAGVVFTRISPAGEQGFPGNCDLKVSYSLTADDNIVIKYLARTDEACPVNLTNHTYFNLSGAGSGTILDHSVQLFADHYLPVDAQAIPTGDLAPVEGTPFDFRTPKAIRRDIEAVTGGYDHNWCVNRDDSSCAPVAGVYEPLSGRALTVYSTQPGVQLYTGNFLNGEKGKNGDVYGKHAGFCLETQHYPDSPNRPAFPDTVILPGERYNHETIWHFDYN